MRDGDAVPELSVAVPTRNRPDDLRQCVATILANPEQAMELIVVDQSDGSKSADALRDFSNDGRLRYHATQSRGQTRGRNEALALARARIVAFTDDDCRVANDFVANVRGFFSAHPDVSLAFGRVVAPPELWERGFVATFDAEERIMPGAFASPVTPWGIGANMAVRVSDALRVGAFDPNMGPGALVPVGGDELDFTMRIIGAGLTVAHTRAFEVTHLGVREGAAGRGQFGGYSSGAGAAYMKNLRLGTPGVGKLFGSWLVHHGSGAVLGALRGRRPLGLGMMISTLKGALGVARLPLDREKKAFAPRKTGNR